MSSLTSLPAHRLLAMLESREVSSAEVVRAHLDRIERYDGALKAYTRVYAEKAIAEAHVADDARMRGLALGRLAGLPVSIKECLDVAGELTTIGVPKKNRPAARQDAALVTLLRQEGAIVLGRTNVSQLMLFNESSNPIFGRTSHPMSLAHTPGGSSGGEAAAIGAGMSPLGIGTDIGGSIRVPAAFCGIVGLKPTLDRWPMLGVASGIPGQEVIRGMAGPMARSVRDVVLAMKAFDPQAMTALDGRTPPLPWPDPDAVDVRALRVGVYVDDGFVRPSRSVERAVRAAAKALEGQGVRVVEFRPPELHRAIGMYFGALSADGALTMERGTAGGPVERPLKGLKVMAQLPKRVREGLADVVGLLGENLLESLLDNLGEKSVADLWALTAAIRAYRATFLESMREAGLDAILTVPYATPPLPHGMSRNFVMAGSPAMLFNMLQLPACVVPVGTVRPNETARTPVLGLVDRHAARVDRKSAGLPLGVQIAGRPWDEATVLALSLALEDALAGEAERPRLPLEGPIGTLRAFDDDADEGDDDGSRDGTSGL
jgi:fatty acid amide hydrolase